MTINVGRLLFQFPVPIILALLINECKWKRFNKIAQTIFTFPYFLSWVIVASIVTNVLSLDGMVNSLLAMLNLDKTNFLGNSTLFIPLLYLTDSWKSAGWSAIIYLAALSGIDVDQYEAAELDGANRWQTLIRVTLPNLKPTVLVMLVLSIGNLMTGGFDQIFNLSNPAVEDICEILDMYIYRITFGSVPDFGFSMAISLFRSVVNCIFLIGILGAIYALTGQFDLLTNLGTFVGWVFYTLTFLAVMAYRKQAPDLERTYKVPAYPVIPIIAIVSGLYVLLNQLFMAGPDARKVAVGGIILVLIGLPVRAIFTKKKAA